MILICILRKALASPIDFTGGVGKLIICRLLAHKVNASSTAESNNDILCRAGSEVDTYSFGKAIGGKKIDLSP